MAIDTDKIDDTVLALLYLTLHDGARGLEGSRLGKALFIPSFFIVTSLLIDPVAFAGDVVDHFPLALGIVVALLAGKWIAAAPGPSATRRLPDRRYGC